MSVRALGDFATLISCKDYRVEDVLEKPTDWVYAHRLAERLQKREVFVMHLSYVRPLGVRNLVLVIRNRDLAKRLASAPRSIGFEAISSVIPKPRLVSNIYLVGGSTVVIVWHELEGLDYGWLWEYALRMNADVYRVIRYPVHTCKPKPQLGDVDELAKRYRELVRTSSIRVRNKSLALALITLLDEYPLASLKQIISVKLLATARDLLARELPEEMLRYRYVLRYYRELSRGFILGRFRVVWLREVSAAPRGMIMAEPENCERLYGYLAYKRDAAYMYCGDIGLGITGVTSGYQNEVKKAFGLYPETRIVYRIFSSPFPFELYDPLENRWRSHPVPGVLNLLKKLGYVRKS